jgi:hypothetical protein
VLVCRDLPGDKWIAMGPGARVALWSDLWARFLQLIRPTQLLGWGAGPVERTEYDEAGRRVRLFVEGVALVPDVVGFGIGSAAGDEGK